MAQFILAVDIGTSSTKALAVTAQGQVLASHQVAYPTRYPRPDFAEQDPAEILSAVKTCISETIVALPAQGLLALSFSAAMHSVVAVDAQGRPLTSLIIWSDMRSVDESAEIASRKDSFNLYRETGTAIHPMLPLCKIMWLKKHEPAVMQKVCKFLSIKDYVLYHLTGRWVTDYAMAGSTGFFDLRAKTWHPATLALAGIDESKLPDLVPSAFVLPLASPAGKELKLPPNLPVIAGASDGCLANLGTNVLHRGELAVTIGTSGAVRMTVEQPLPDNKMRTFNYLLDEQRIVTGGATNNGAVLLSWFEHCFGKDGASVFDDVEAACRHLPDDLIFLPFVLGERAPVYDPHARGVFFGLNMTHHRSHLLRAVVEGICFSLFSIARALRDVAGDYNVIYASGGFIHSPGWIQLLSDVFGKKVRVVESGDASALGAARLAFTAIKSTDHFFENTPEPKIFYPDTDLHIFYQKKVEIFLSLYQNLKQDFYNLSKLNKPTPH